ncbi:MAG: hypothetical protein D6759_16495, partial [Chloroflexi bacterium]
MTMGTRQVVLDTNVLVGLVDSQDSWHSAAVALHHALKEAQGSLVYFDCVINEAISVLARRARERKRVSEFSDLLTRLTSQVPAEAIVWVSADTRHLYR